MGAKNCPETPRQKMINMMYIVLTAMLALNVAAEVLEAFRVVDASLMQTLKAVDMQNAQISSSFEQAYAENPTKVEEWKKKADDVKQKSEDMINYVSNLKDELVTYSGSEEVSEENPTNDRNFYHVTSTGDTVKIVKQDDLNGPSEMMITQGQATELKNTIVDYRNFLVSQLSEDDTELIQTILSELNTSNPKKRSKDEEDSKTWESEHFEDKPLIAVLTPFPALIILTIFANFCDG